MGLLLAWIGISYHLVVFISHFTSRGNIFTANPRLNNNANASIHHKSSFSKGRGTKNTKIKPPSSIRTINLIGERHSGTKWITSHIQDCFGDQITVLNRYTRYKHWFQYGDRDESDTYYHPPKSSLVVSIFRDPYEWVDSMIKKPYHSPNHFDLDWKSFITKPWTIDRWYGDQAIIDVGTQLNATCMHRFAFDEVIPCSGLDRHMNNITRKGRRVGVIYELNHDGSGRPYDSILELRRDKIKNFLNVAKYDGVASLIPVQYEYLVSKGTARLIGQIESITGLQANCKPDPPRRARIKDLDANFIQYMNDNVDWKVEQLIGYNKRDTSSESTRRKLTVSTLYPSSYAPTSYAPTSYSPTTTSHMKNLELHSSAAFGNGQ